MSSSAGNNNAGSVASSAPLLLLSQGKQQQSVSVPHNMMLLSRPAARDDDDVSIPAHLTATDNIGLVFTFTRDALGFQTSRVLFETLSESSNEAPPLLVYKAEARRFNARTPTPSAKMDYLLVGITEEHLWHEAEESTLTLNPKP